MVRVHTILADNVRRDGGLRQTTLDALRGRLRMENVDLARFERHGILSADVAEDDIPAARDVSGVQSVERDRRQRAI